LKIQRSSIGRPYDQNVEIITPEMLEDSSITSDPNAATTESAIDQRSRDLRAPSKPRSPSRSISRIATVDRQLVGTADLDGDAHPELIWRNQNSGEVRAWKLSGHTISADASLGIATPDRQIVGFGDLT
jgi:hypothetical protein